MINIVYLVHGTPGDGDGVLVLVVVPGTSTMYPGIIAQLSS